MPDLVTVCAGAKGQEPVRVEVGDLPGSIEATVHSKDCPGWCEARPGGSIRATPDVARGSTTVDRACIVPHDDGTRVVPTVAYHRDLVADWSRRTARDRVSLPGPPDREAHRQMRQHQNAASDLVAAEDGVRALLRLMGEDPTRTGLADTPARVVKAYLELADRPGDVAELLGRQFEDGPKDGEMVTVRGIEFVSICEHHLLPFVGTATIAYIPASDRIVGLSKLPRLLHHFARRPQVQERLTGQVTAAIEEHLDTHGAACRIEATHECMSLRGVRAQDAAMVTTSLTGRFLENPATRAEFLGEASR